MKFIKYWIFFLPLVFISCENLDFYGDTFYSVKGKITDENDQIIPNFDLSIYTDKDSLSSYPKNYFADGIISGTGKTDENGEFLITFPKSNGYNFLVIENDYQIIDSINSGAYNINLAKLDIIKFRDFLLDIKTLKITKP